MSVYFYLKGQSVKTNSGHMVAYYLEITSDGKSNVIMSSSQSKPDVNSCRVYHIDNGIEEMYSGELLVKTPIDGYEDDDYRSGIHTKRFVPTSYEYQLCLPKNDLRPISDDLIGVIMAIISQPKLKADDVEKELKALGYDLEFKPFKLLTSNGWKAKSISDSEKFEPISQLLLSLISQT